MGLFFYYFSGVLGVARAVTSLGYFNWNRQAVCLAAFLFCGLICLIGMGGKRYPAAGFAGLALCGGVFVAGRDWLWEQWTLALEVFQERPGAFSHVDLTGLLLVLVLFMAVYLYWLSLILHKGWLFYPVTGLLMAAKPWLGGEPDLTAVCLLTFFHLGDRAAAAAAYRKRDGALCMDRRMLRRSQGRGILAAAVLALCLLLPAMGLTWGRREELFGFPLKVEQDIRRSMQVELQLKMAPPVQEDGRVSRGNRNFTGQDMLAVKVSEQPGQTIYLKEFTGSDYGNDRWLPAKEKAFLEEMAPGDEKRQEELGLRLDTLSYGKAMTADREDSREKWMALKRLSGQPGGNDMELRPYISRFEEENEGVRWYSWYGLEDYYGLLRAFPPSGYSPLEKAYEAYVYRQYTRVERERFPRLARLCEENPASGWMGVTDVITEMLQSRASYSLTPGMIPVGEEIPEYFLFEQKQGYCVHFATTAVLMYRMYGIPARYAAGYIAPAAQFSADDDGSWNGVLQDHMAHAWPEIYVEGKGWIPVEVTPGTAFEEGVLADGGIVQWADADVRETEELPEEIDGDQENEWESRAEETETALQEEMDPPDMDTAFSGEAEVVPGLSEETGEQRLPEETFLAGTEKGERPLEEEEAASGLSAEVTARILVILTVLSGCVCLVLLLYGAFRLLKRRRARILEQQKSCDPARLYARLEQVMRLGGYPLDFSEGTRVCADRLAEAIPEIEMRQAEQAMNTVDMAAFGNREPTLRQRRQMWSVYETACRHVREGLNPWLRWYFDYVKVFL